MAPWGEASQIGWSVNVPKIRIGISWQCWNGSSWWKTLKSKKKLLFTRSFGWINTSSTLGVLLPGNVVLVPSWTENLGILGFIYRKNFGCNGHTLWLNDTASSSLSYLPSDQVTFLECVFFFCFLLENFKLVIWCYVVVVIPLIFNSKRSLLLIFSQKMEIFFDSLQRGMRQTLITQFEIHWKKLEN